ncbi:MAG: aspartate--tRNA ligase [Myxococcales bacterium]|jgi:aspartyl-tRNA synthetase|nr:aspartate--tRNA ligase [Myxococcales bacterium]
MSKMIDELKRTHSCGELTAADVGKQVVLFGWVHSRRDHGKAVFIDLRDRMGITQVVFEPRFAEGAHTLAGDLRLEYVIGVRGTVESRGGNVNPKMKTGEIEVHVTDLEIFNKSEPLPFLIEDEINAEETTRLAYRYLDLRRPAMQRLLMTRSKINQLTRDYFSRNGFLELETPFLVKYTPGGARNFLVPCRVAPGKFYALAESPQLFKQLFMVAGFDRYFQLVRCFRDEDLRLDRQPEFTQIDVEMSFVTQDDIFAAMEGLVALLWKELLGVDIPLPLPRMEFDESMRRFGNDKPDLRFGLEHIDFTDVVKSHAGGGVPLFEATLAQGGIFKAIRVPKEYALSRKDLDELEKEAKGMGSMGLGRAKIGEAGAWSQTPFAKAISDDLRLAINAACGAQEGDLIVFQMGRPAMVHAVLANLRLTLGKKFGLIPPYGSGGQWRFLWVVNPPLFEFDEESKTWVAAHHAFTRPHDADLAFLDSDPGKVKCYRYDLVLNGFEIGGGSIRLHDPEVQKKVFQTLGIDEAEARQKFGFLLDALRFGAPPHGGIALGMDRVAMLLTGASSLRDIVAFPKTLRGTDLMTGAPGDVSDRQLKDLHVQTVKGA